MLSRPFPFRRSVSTALLAACLPIAASALPVRIASFNICNASGTEKLTAISNILQRVRPDILALEEATTGQEAAYTTLFASLATPLPYHVFMPNPGSGRGTQSDKVAIYSRWPIVSSSIVKETDADPEAVEFMRWPLHAVIEVEGALNPLHVIALHAAASTVSTPRRIWRGLETERVEQFIASHILANDPNATEYVVLGDFNDSANGRYGEDNASSFQPASFSYDTFHKYETNGTFASPFRLGSDAAWHSNNTTRASHTMLYRTYPNDRLSGMTPVSALRTGSGDDWTTCLDGNVYRLDYILFSEEIASSAYGAPEGEVYYSPADRQDDSGLAKPGDFSQVDPAASTNASDHLLLFADFHMIDEIGGITPVAILSEVAHCATNTGATFIELCNTGAGELDLDGCTLELYLNGAATASYTRTLSDLVLGAGATYWIAGNEVNASNVWGRAPDAVWSRLQSLNGNDAVVLRNSSGAIQDVYGVVGVDGTAQPWAYADATAIRRAGVTEPAVVWNADEWTISPSAEATPGEHCALLEADVTLSAPQIHAYGRDSTAPTASEAFYFTVTATPNALASNLAASAVFRVDGGIWQTNEMTLADAGGTLWQSDALDVARAGGSVADFFVSVAFEGTGAFSPVHSAVSAYTFPGAASATNLTDVLLNEVKTSGAADFVELVGGAGVDVSGWSLALFDTNANAVWSYQIPSGTAIPSDGALDEWGNAAGFLVLAASASVANADLVADGCTDGAGLFADDEPRVLVLANAAGGVVDAVAWIATNEFESILMPETLSTSVARGAGNFLHCLGAAAAGAADSLQAPDNVRVGTADASVYALPAWTDATATPGEANVSQTARGGLVLARVDRDADGLLDDEDNCPDTFNPAQSDIDDDGIGDECDEDMDGDGIPNRIDNCPTEPNRRQEDFDADGVGNVCDPDYDEEDSFGRYETLWLPFEDVPPFAADEASVFTEAGRAWQATGAAVVSNAADAGRIGHASLRVAPGAVLALDGVLTNRLAVVGFFFCACNGATSTPPVVVELSSDEAEWREYARVETDAADGLAHAVVALSDAPAGSHVRLRVTGSGTEACLDLDDILFVCVVRQTADATLDAPLAVAYDGAVHTNEFTVQPADAVWRATYATDGGEPTAAPVDVGVYTATVTVEDADDLVGGSFVFERSLTISESLPDPEILSCRATNGAVAAELSACVRANRAEETLLATFEYGTDTNFANKVVADGSPVGGFGETALAATLEGLSPGTRYYWRVNVGDVSGPVESFLTDALAAPEVSAAKISAHAFTLDWPACLGAADYLVDVRLGEAVETQYAEHFADWPASTTAGGTSVPVEGEGGIWHLLNATVYAGGASGIGSSNVVYLRNKSSGWGGGSSAYGYLETPAWEGVEEISFVARRATSFFGGNGSGTITLQTSDDGGTTWTDAASYSIARTVSSNRYTFAAAATNAVCFRFCNTGNAGVYLHDVFVSLASGAASLEGFPAVCSSNTLRVGGLDAETTYEVLAKTEYPGSLATAWSEPIAVTTRAPAAPPVLALDAATDASLAFSWNAVEGAQTYRLEISLDAAFASGATRIAESFERNTTNETGVVTTSNGWQIAISGANCGVNASATTGMTGTGTRIRWTKTSTAAVALAIPVAAGATVSLDSLALWAGEGTLAGLTLAWGTEADGCTNAVEGFAEPTGTGSWQTVSSLPLGCVSSGTLHLLFRKTATDSAAGVDELVLTVLETPAALETGETAAWVEGLASATRYYARVSADDGETWSETVEATTAGEAPPIPGVPVLAVGHETTNGFSVSWDAVENADRYRLEWCAEADFPEAGESLLASFEGGGLPEGWSVGHTAGTSDPTVVSNAAYAAEGTTNALRLTAAGRYLQTPRLSAPGTLAFWYCVPTAGEWALAVQVAGEEDFSDAVTVETLSTTDAVASATLHEVDLRAHENVFVRLIDARAEGTKYRYLDEVSVSARSDGEVFGAETAALAYDITGLGSGETWFVRAAAANGNATSAWSGIVSATTLSRFAGVSVVLEPESATWTLLGEDHASGETAGGLEPGDYEITFSPVDGYDTPPPLAVTLAAGETNTLSVAYEKSIFLDTPVLAVGEETTDGFTVSWDAVSNAFSYAIEWSRFASFAGRGEDIARDFEDGALPEGWSAGHDTGRYWAWGIVSNAHTAAAGMGKAFRFDHSEAGAYLALPRIPSPGELTYRYAVPDSRAWTLAVQVASEEDFSDAVTVETLSTTGPVAAGETHAVDLSAFTNVFVRFCDQRDNNSPDPRYLDDIVLAAREGTEVFSVTCADSPLALEGLGSGETWFVRAAAANASVTSAWSAVASATTRAGTMTDYERWATAAGIADLWGTNAEGVAWAEAYLRWTNGLDTLHAAAADGAYEILVPTNGHGIAVDIEVAEELPGDGWRAPAEGELSPAGNNRYDIHPTNDPARLFLRLRLSPAD